MTMPLRETEQQKQELCGNEVCMDKALEIHVDG